LAGGGRGTEERRPCSGGEGHRRRGPSGGEVPGAHGGSIGLLVEGRGRERGSPRESEAAAEESMATLVLRRSTSAKDLRMTVGGRGKQRSRGAPKEEEEERGGAEGLVCKNRKSRDLTVK
jgi:hypothetical protein